MSRVYFGNLVYEARAEQVREFAEQVGPAESVDVLERNGRSRGCAIVTYGSEDLAQRAIAELNDLELMGRKVFVREDREAPPTSNNAGFGLFVENLAFSTNWASLKDHFRSAGPVLRSDVHTYAGRSKGRGTVVMETEEGAQFAIAHLNNSQLDGRTIRVRADLDPSQRPNALVGGQPSQRVVLSNLPWAFGDQDLVQLVSQFALPTSASVDYLGDGRSAGTASATFASVPEAGVVVDSLNGCRVGERRIQVVYA